MTTEFKVPELGEGVKNAEVAQIYISSGDMITVDQNVMELETDKAVADLPCTIAGKVVEVLVAEGDTIQIGQAVLVIDESGEAAPVKVEESVADVVPEPEPPKPEPPKPPKRKKAKEKPAAKKVPKASKPAASKTKSALSVPPAGPATRRLARELGVDLDQVQGSASGGRITQEDVARAHAAKVQPVSSGAAPAAVSIEEPPLPDFSKYGPVERVKLNKIAKTSAATLSHAWRTIPHVTQHETTDVTELESSRKRHNVSRSEDAPKITMSAFALKAVAVALKEFPHFNASFDSAANELVLKQYCNIGMAVDTDQGLLVPVIRDVDKKSIAEIAADLIELAEKARTRKLTLDDMSGGTFTISNLGGIGGTGFTPIVLHPQVAILGLSRLRTELKMIDGAPRERLQLPLSLSYDHRVINGADGARFIVRLAETLSDPIQLLFEK
jgi:pyruvate dehydrogenase E2 component (dihydrolipoamide acetyltransferase)